MALESLLSLNAVKGIPEEYDDLAKLDQMRYDKLEDEEDIKSMIPKFSKNDKIKLPKIVDDVNGRELSMHFRKGTTTLAFIYKNGIVVCADSRATGGQYIGSGTVKKIIPITNNILGTMAGGAADCMYWERLLSERCRLYELRNRQPISVAAASKLLVNMLYNYKNSGLSVGCMISGWDQKSGPKIFFVDNDSRRVPGTMFSVGSGSVYAYGVLDQGYRFDLEDEEAFDLGRRAIFHATHRDPASGGIVRVYTINQNGWRIVSEEDMQVLYDRYAEEKSFSIDH